MGRQAPALCPLAGSQVFSQTAVNPNGWPHGSARGSNSEGVHSPKPSLQDRRRLGRQLELLALYSLAQVTEDASVTPEERFAANLRRQRLAKGLSQEQLAEKTGVHPSEVSRLERAARDPRLSTIVKVARGLGVSPERLVKGVK
jgi:ribosome-binding protein aMBF1 (putative translation factor)